MWANAISYVLARIINFCLGEEQGREGEEGEGIFVERERVWQELRGEVMAWREGLPASFEPFSRAPKAGNVFPSIWLVSPCHGEFTILEIYKHH